jgi:hypothetical protein
MSKEALKIISDAMESLGLPYGFMEYKVGKDEEAPETYFVGEYQELEPTTEDGLQESTFLLTGFSRGTWLALEDAKKAICNYFNKVSGKTVIADSGSAVAIFYSNSLVVPTGDAELKRIQINLDVKEWSVN